MALAHLRWLLRPAAGYERQSGMHRGSFLRGVGLAGPKGFAQAFLPTMEFYTAAAEAGLLP